MTGGVEMAIGKPKVRREQFFRPAAPVFKGRKGLEALKIIQNKPAPDFSNVDKEISDMLVKMNAARENGTY